VSNRTLMGGKLGLPGLLRKVFHHSTPSQSSSHLPVLAMPQSRAGLAGDVLEPFRIPDVARIIKA
jgi:hypothetical protein